MRKTVFDDVRVTVRKPSVRGLIWINKCALSFFFVSSTCKRFKTKTNSERVRTGNCMENNRRELKRFWTVQWNETENRLGKRVAQVLLNSVFLLSNGIKTIGWACLDDFYRIPTNDTAWTSSNKEARMSWVMFLFARWSSLLPIVLELNRTHRCICTSNDIVVQSRWTSWSRMNDDLESFSKPRFARLRIGFLPRE